MLLSSQLPLLRGSVAHDGSITVHGTDQIKTADAYCARRQVHRQEKAK